MITSERIIASAKSGRSLFDHEAARVAHRADLVVELDKMRSADPAYMQPDRVLWRKMLRAERVAAWARLRAENPEWSESKLDWELSPYTPEKLVSVGKDKDGNDLMVCESQARGRWSPYPGMTKDG